MSLFGSDSNAESTASQVTAQDQGVAQSGKVNSNIITPVSTNDGGAAQQGQYNYNAQSQGANIIGVSDANIAIDYGLSGDELSSLLNNFGDTINTATETTTSQLAGILTGEQQQLQSLTAAVQTGGASAFTKPITIVIIVLAILLFWPFKD